jgi:hypothetical protein
MIVFIWKLLKGAFFAGSFSCLLAASLAEKIVVMSHLRTKMGRLVQSMSGQNTAFLYAQLLLMLLVVAFAAQILYEVYLVGDTGARRCRSVVLLSLLSTGIVAFVCVRQAGTVRTYLLCSALLCSALLRAVIINS